MRGLLLSFVAAVLCLGWVQQISAETPSGRLAVSVQNSASAAAVRAEVFRFGSYAGADDRFTGYPVPLCLPSSGNVCGME